VESETILETNDLTKIRNVRERLVFSGDSTTLVIAQRSRKKVRKARHSEKDSSLRG
jgi:hypothetical protein